MVKYIQSLVFIFPLFFSLLNAKEAKHPIRTTEQLQENCLLPRKRPDYSQIYTPLHEEIIAYIENFPFEYYELCDVPGQGRFYVDTTDDIIKSVLAQGNVWEAHISNMIEHFARPGSIVLDIGAHIGTHTIAMSRAVGEDGAVLAFEPQPKIFRELFVNMYENGASNIHFYWAAVGDGIGTLELAPFSRGNEGGTSFLNSKKEFMGGTGIFVDMIDIDLLQLDDVSFIKIDVEQMEDFVLEGAKDTILRNKPVIIIEIMGGFIPEFCSLEVGLEAQKHIDRTVSILQNLGYKVTKVGYADYLALPL